MDDVLMIQEMMVNGIEYFYVMDFVGESYLCQEG